MPLTMADFRRDFLKEQLARLAENELQLSATG
jgi:hypothetical protein